MVRKLPFLHAGIKEHVSLVPYTTFGVGGVARYFISTRSPERVVATLRSASVAGVPAIVIAGGSNIVCAEGVIEKLFVRLTGGRLFVTGTKIVVDAGVSLARLITAAVSHGLRGLETLSGIPGSVGGAIVGNAGAYGQAISETLTRVEIYDGVSTKWITTRACRFTYRESIFKHTPWIVLRAEFELDRAPVSELRRIARRIITTRLSKYPLNLRCPGSFFKNVLVAEVTSSALAHIPPEKIIDGKIPAGYLLESVGMRGLVAGPLRIAKYHGNLIINSGGATYDEVRTLSLLLKKKVSDRFGIELDEEVRYVE